MTDAPTLQNIWTITMHNEKRFGSKKIGHIHIDYHDLAPGTTFPCSRASDCFVIVYLKRGSRIISDFREYEASQDQLFFFNMGQRFSLAEGSAGQIVYFNPEFYCIAFHDKELNCDGILFNNIYEWPSVSIEGREAVSFFTLMNEIRSELENKDYWTEEMSRAKLKQLIIMASRSWLKRDSGQNGPCSTEGELSRKFSQLVEANYDRFHNVADYAELLHVSPKTLNRKIVSEKNISPNVFIKNRLMLQARRLLANTDLSVKEIASQLGYKDASYFVRFFKIQNDNAPLEFRKTMKG